DGASKQSAAVGLLRLVQQKPRKQRYGRRDRDRYAADEPDPIADPHIAAPRVPLPGGSELSQKATGIKAASRSALEAASRHAGDERLLQDEGDQHRGQRRKE